MPDQEGRSAEAGVEVIDAPAPLESQTQASLRETTARVLDSLTPREEQVLRMRFGIGMNTGHTPEEVGQQFSVTRERIRQIEERAMRKLKTQYQLAQDHGFRPVTADDLATISDWLGRSHIAEWWSDPHEQIETLRRNLAEAGFEALILLLDGRPVGYLQVYDASPGTPGATLDQPSGTRGLDLFIAECEALGRGHGPTFVRLITERLLTDPAVIRVIADPDPANVRSIRCFEKAGFCREREARQPWGPIVLMVHAKEHVRP